MPSEENPYYGGADDNNDDKDFRCGDLPCLDRPVNERGVDLRNSQKEGPNHLSRCRGTDRPRGKNPTLPVEAPGQILTVHDYVSAVHPWLLELRNGILQAVRGGMSLNRCLRIHNLQ